MADRRQAPKPDRAGVPSAADGPLVGLIFPNRERFARPWPAVTGRPSPDRLPRQPAVGASRQHGQHAPRGRNRHVRTGSPAQAGPTARPGRQDEKGSHRTGHRGPADAPSAVAAGCQHGSGGRRWRGCRRHATHGRNRVSQQRPVSQHEPRSGRGRVGRVADRCRADRGAGHPDLAHPVGPRSAATPVAPGDLRPDPGGCRRAEADGPGCLAGAPVQPADRGRSGGGRDPRRVSDHRHVDRADPRGGQGERSRGHEGTRLRHPRPPDLEQPATVRGHGRLLGQPPQRDQSVRRRLGHPYPVRQ